MKLLIILLFCITCFADDEDHWYRYIAMPASAAAYSDNPNLCWSNMQQHMIGYPNVSYSIYRQYSVRCESFNDTCAAYIAIENYTTPKNISIFVVFRGTNNNYEFFESGWNYDEMVPFPYGGKVSKHFYNGFNDLWNSGMKDDLLTLKNKYPNSTFYFLGHSIGGAMASLAATTLKRLNFYSNMNVLLYTFGQPRIGDGYFVDAFSMSDIFTKNIIHKADIVPHLPPLGQSEYYHHDFEFWYPGNMGINDFCISCYREDSTCSNSLPASDYNMEDHKNYFDRDFIEYGKNGCPDLVTSKQKKPK